MLYHAAKQNINTNKVILALKESNIKYYLSKEEIQWVNRRWKRESDLILKDEWSRPIVPIIFELKVTAKKINKNTVWINFAKLKIKPEKIKIPLNSIPFYWTYLEKEKLVFIPAIKLKVESIGTIMRINMADSKIRRNGKWISFFDHPLLTWKGKIPTWAKESMTEEDYIIEPIRKNKRRRRQAAIGKRQ